MPQTFSELGAGSNDGAGSRITRSEELSVRTPGDIVLARQAVREWAKSLGLSLIDQTKIITAASELARNMLDYGGGGTLRLECLENGMRVGLRLIFTDSGPGIPNIPLALTDGYTSGGGMGMGLGGAKRLVNEFEIRSTVGAGTCVTATRWK